MSCIRSAIKASAPLALLGAALLINGCAGGDRSSGAVVPDTSKPSVRTLPGILTDNQVGLEIQWWTVTDSEEVIAQALAPYEDNPTPMTGSVRASWRRNGFRLVAVPAAELPALLGALPIEDKFNRIWLGQAPQWTVAAPGAPWEEDRSLLIDGETIRLGRGRLRLLVRAWVAPTESSPTLRTDLAIQYQDRAGAIADSDPFGRATIRRPETMGMIFRTLTASMELERGWVYCVVSEDPGVEWSEIVRAAQSKREDDTDPDENAEPTLPRQAPPPDVAIFEMDHPTALGPEPPGIPVLADALLSRVELLPTRRRARSIVILSPAVPESFRIAP